MVESWLNCCAWRTPFDDELGFEAGIASYFLIKNVLQNFANRSVFLLPTLAIQQVDHDDDLDEEGQAEGEGGGEQRRRSGREGPASLRTTDVAGRSRLGLRSSVEALLRFLGTWEDKEDPRLMEAGAFLEVVDEVVEAQDRQDHPEHVPDQVLHHPMMATAKPPKRRISWRFPRRRQRGCFRPHAHPGGGGDSNAGSGP